MLTSIVLAAYDRVLIVNEIGAITPTIESYESTPH